MHDFFVARVWCGVCVWCVWLRVALAWSRPCASVCAAWSAAWTVCRVAEAQLWCLGRADEGRDAGL